MISANVETITPVAASALLAKNDNNRNLTPSRVAAWEEALRTGRWELNGESIKISRTGKLLDGQHRLHAVVNSGITFTTLVVRGLPDDVFATIDSGKPRSAADTLSTMGHHSTTSLAANAAVCLRVLNASSGAAPYSVTPSKGQVLDYVERNPMLAAKSMEFCKTGGPVIGTTTLSAFHYLFSTVSATQNAPTLADAFAHQLVEGVFDTRCGVDTKRSPVYMLRERLVASRGSRTRINAEYKAKLIVKAWNAYAAGVPIGVLRAHESELFPRIL